MPDRLWRITRAPHADLSGEGARLFGGRWNPVGTPVVYASTALSLAVLEALVHVDPDILPDDLVAVEIETRGARTEELAGRELPNRWRVEIGHAETQEFGARWIREARSALLVLPSALLPDVVTTERNVLINTAHPDAGEIRIAGTYPFHFDDRLLTP